MFLPSRNAWKKNAWENWKKKHMYRLSELSVAREKRDLIIIEYPALRVWMKNSSILKKYSTLLSAKVVLRKTERSDESYLVRILPLGPSSRKQSWAAYFVRESQQIQNKKSLVRVPYHKLLNNLAWSSLNGGYSVVFVRISSRFGRTPATSGLVQPLSSVSKNLIHFSKSIFFLLRIDIVHEEPRGRFNTKFLLSKWFRHYFLITRRISNFLKAEKTITTFR